MPITHGHGNPIWTREETILALNIVLKYWPKIPSKTSQQVQALSSTLRSLPIHPISGRTTTFRNEDGVYLKLLNLASLHPDNARKRGLNTSITDRRVWNDYADDSEAVERLSARIVSGAALVKAATGGIDETDDDGFETYEGKILYSIHRRRERDRRLRKKLIAKRRRLNAALRCDCCGFISRLIAPYDEAYFDVHHVVPLAYDVERPTTLKDLSLLCANCHRMVHAIMRSEAKQLTLDEIRTWCELHDGGPS